MSYSNKHRYKNRREKAVIINRNVKRALFFFGIALLVYIYKRRVSIIDYISLYL